jgi:neutral ceramidase
MVEGERKPGLGWPEALKKYSRTAKQGTNLVRLPVNFLKINDNIGIWAAPLELFCEISNEIRDRSPFPFTFYYGYTNGWLGYLPTEEEWKHGGYEVDVVSPYTPAMGRTLIENVVSYFEGELLRK